MVAILMAALLGSGLSTLLLAKFSVMIVLVAMPFAGSIAGLAAALGLAAARDRHLRTRRGTPSLIKAPAMTRSFTIAR